MAPRPIQRPSDVERHPIDFGIEAPPPGPVRPEATIIKSAISRDPEPALESLPNPSQTETQADVQLTGAPQPNSVEKSVNLTNEQITNIEEDWGEGIL